jgi:hypothetical protein
MALFLAGRFLAYAAVGALAGSLGALASGFLAPQVDRILLRAGWALGGVLLLAGGLAGFKGSSFCRRLASFERPTAASFALGLAAGLNICPPFVAAASRAAGLGAWGGALYFSLFFLGTSAWVLLVAALPPAKRRASELESVARIAMTMLGAYFFVVLGALGWS